VSPNFLYRAEVGLPPRPGETAARLGPWETASRLSYLLLGSMPDQELYRAAEAGELATREQVAAQARRLLADPRARPVVAHFHDQWLELERISTIEKDRRVYPAFTPELRGFLETEARMFLDSVTWEAPGDIASLFGAGHSFMNARLASFYGVKGPAGATFERVAQNPQQRAGFLTQAGLLAVLAKVNQTSPVERGLFVREQLLCDPPPPPPPGLQGKPPDLDPRLTTRERFTQHKENPACVGCHALMDPIGLGFESYDGLGAWRTAENGRPVDASGEIVGTDIAGPFVGAIELLRKLGRSAQVSRCVRTQWFRFAYGRNVTAEDECNVATLDAALAAGKGNVRELLVALTQTDSFLYKQIGGAP
jgi:hypothetical protein